METLLEGTVRLCMTSIVWNPLFIYIFIIVLCTIGGPVLVFPGNVPFQVASPTQCFTANAGGELVGKVVRTLE